MSCSGAHGLLDLRIAVYIRAVPLLAGLALGFSLIVAIGAQNVFVLRQGIRREHVLLVVAICASSDALLIVAGVSGAGAATAALPWLVPVVRWGGALFLGAYGILAARRALSGSGQALVVGTPPGSTPLAAPARPPSATAASVALTCLTLTWLNPHVYLDTVFLLGSVAGTHGDRRWEFALGAVIASTLWFSSLAYGARFLGRRLASPASWRVLDAVIAAVMLALGVSLVLG